MSTTKMFLSLKSIFNASAAESHPSKPPSRTTPPRQIISETLIEELESQIRETEEHLKEVQRKINEDSGRPDYSWLRDAQKAYRIPQITRLELEDASRLLKPDDVSGIINEFRNSISKDLPVDKLPNYLKFIISSHLQNKRKHPSYTPSNYVQLEIAAENDQVPERSQSSAIIKKNTFLTNYELQRPQSAPVSNSWKKRVKVHPSSGLVNKHTSNCYIELGDNTDVSSVIENANQITSTSIV